MARPSILNNVPIDAVDQVSASFTIGYRRFYFSFFTFVVLSLTTCHSWTSTTALTANINPYCGEGSRLHNPRIRQHACIVRDRRGRRPISTQIYSHKNDEPNQIRRITTPTILNSEGDNNIPKDDDNRRNFLYNLTKIILTFNTITPIAPAMALQKKNEALCGTGFFEHYDEFRCTAIGDISDEGSSKALSGKEADISDGLMSKMGVVMNEDDGEGKKKKTDGNGSVVGGGGREGSGDGEDARKKR